ncbi:MAG: thermonuclease family protein [Candidatus Shapirobacteria bacterium]|nr:thermonuclease family protein [Candidatus Shapirobacteria bacterium]
MRKIIKNPVAIIAFLLIIVTSFLNNQSNQKITSKNLSQVIPTPTSTPAQTQLFKVTRVIDGDTIEIENGQKVRYIGINTPEMDDKDPVKLCLAKIATLENKKLVEGKEVKLEKDISETDKYDRLLRYVYIGEIFVNDYLVRQGFAQISTYPPDVKFKEQFKKAEQEAQDNNRGLWNKELCQTN